jgi:hypothetical protein
MGLELCAPGLSNVTICNNFFNRKNPKLKQTKIGGFGSSSERPMTQAYVDRLVLDFIIETGQAFSVVNKPSFNKLVTALQPSKTLMSYHTLMNRYEFNKKSYL